MSEMPRLSPRNEVIQVVRGWIANGRLSPGTRLPAEQTIAEEVGVSRGTVRSALQELERLRVLVGHEHRGYRTPETDGERHPLLGGAIVLVSDVADEAVASGFTGVESGFELGAFRAARRLQRPVIGIPPAVLDATGCMALVRSAPLGVIAAHQVAASPDGQEALKRLLRHRIPVVVNGDGEGLDAFDRVVSDFSAGTSDLVRLLADQGRRRILRIWSTSENPYWLVARDAGFTAAVHELGLDALPAVRIPLSPRIIDDLSVFDVRTRQYLGFMVEHLSGAQAVDAILLVSDSDYFPVARACRMLGREPGRDIAICGYDAYWHRCWERTIEPTAPFATVDRANDAIGEVTVATLEERVNGSAKAPPLLKVVAPRLVRPAATP